MGCTPSDSHESAAGTSNTLPATYNTNSYVTFLCQAATKGDGASVIRCLQECPPMKMSQLTTRYREVVGTPLLTDCADKMSATGAFTVRLLVDPRPAVTSHLLHRCLAEGPEGVQSLVVEGPEGMQSLVVEVVCLYPQNQIQELQNLYRSHHREELVNAIQTSGHLCQEVRDILAAHLKADQIEDVSETTQQCAQFLIEGATGSHFFSKHGPFMVTMTTRSREELKHIFELFLKGCQRDLGVEVDRAFPPGPTRDGLKLIVEVIRTPWHHLASRIHTWLGDENPLHQVALLYFLLTLTQTEIAELKHAYQSTYFETLSTDIRNLVQDLELQQTLVRAVH